VTPLIEPFLAAANERRLTVQVCTACRTAQLPPRMRCSTCGATTLAWETASGRARLVSYTVLHRAPGEPFQDRLPYVYALVELDEGPRIVSNVVGSEPADLRIGRRLAASWEDPDGSGQLRPVFALDPAD
jgi:uncharacterized OB-fold protein